jgi:hypothetical protein
VFFSSTINLEQLKAIGVPVKEDQEEELSRGSRREAEKNVMTAKVF